MMSWFAVAVDNHMDAEEGIAELGFPLFCPRERVFRIKRGRKVQDERPLFPGYLFTAFDRSDERWPAIEHTDGVLGILKNGGIPVPARDDEIAQLRLAETLGVFDRTKPPRVGLAVEAVDTPLSGFIGKIAKARSADRVIVAIQGLFGRTVNAEMPLSALREA